MALGLLFYSTGVAAERLREFSWSELKAAGQLKNGTIVPPGMKGDVECLLIESSASDPFNAEIFAVTEPGVTQPAYALRARIRYDDVEGRGYFEMWNYFPDGGAYFTRTLAVTGPMASLSGSSDWRDLALPFSAAGTPQRPSKLVVNLVLSGKAKIWVEPPVLYQYGENESPVSASTAWWTDRQSGMIGGIGGGVVGLLAALVGVFCSLGRARSLVLGLMLVAVVAGVIAFFSGVIALFLRQPYGVWYPLMLGGGLSALLFGALRPGVRKRYTERELRHII